MPNLTDQTLVDVAVVSGATVSANPPGSAGIGQLWFDEDIGKTFVYYDSQWVEIGSGSGITSVTVSSSPPASPIEGEMWFDSDTTQSFTYYDSHWIELGGTAMAAQVSSSAPASPIAGQIWYDSSTGATFVYYSNNWVEIGFTPVDPVLNTIDAKGDLLVGTADNAASKLIVGANGTVLRANSSTATGLEWATPTVYQAVVANVSDTEIGYLDGVSSAIQTQLNNKQAVVANVSNTEIGYLDGVTSAIQTQLDTKASTGKAIAMAIVFG